MMTVLSLEAIDQATAGDTVLLSSDVELSNLVINTNGLTLDSGLSGKKAHITHGNHKHHFTIVIDGDDVTLRNLSFSGAEAISLRINGKRCSLENLDFEDIKIAFIACGDEVRFKNIRIKRFYEDGIRLASDGFHGENVRIEDLYAKKKQAHHDGIQLYAGKPGTSLRHADRFEGRHAVNKGTLKNIHIKSTTDPKRDSIGQLQGIFASDGFMDGLVFDGVHVETHDCIHAVSLRGVRQAADGTDSSFSNISVSTTPGLKSSCQPQMRFTAARRITDKGRKQFMRSTKSIGGDNSPLKLAEDESNLQEVLFPPALLRDSESDIGKSINQYWAAVPAGEMDQQQGRIVLYEPCIETSSVAVYQSLRK
ncbi:MAG: hypothetical protein ACPG5L_18210 [Vibrio gallaecicus]